MSEQMVQTAWVASGLTGLSQRYHCINVMHHMPEILSMLLKINPCGKTLIQIEDNFKSISSRILKCLVLTREGFYHVSSSKNKLNSCYKV